MDFVQCHFYIKLQYKYCDLAHTEVDQWMTAYCLSYPETEALFCHSVLQTLGAEMVGGARVQPMATNLWVIALSAVSTYKAR